MTYSLASRQIRTSPELRKCACRRDALADGEGKVEEKVFIGGKKEKEKRRNFPSISQCVAIIETSLGEDGKVIAGYHKNFSKLTSKL